jgi:hypothetical protein
MRHIMAQAHRQSFGKGSSEIRIGGASNYGEGFLPTACGGIPLRSSGDPALYLSNPRGIDRQAHRESLDAPNRKRLRGLSPMKCPTSFSRVSRS